MCDGRRGREREEHSSLCVILSPFRIYPFFLLVKLFIFVFVHPATHTHTHGKTPTKVSLPPTPKTPGVVKYSQYTPPPSTVSANSRPAEVTCQSFICTLS